MRRLSMAVSALCASLTPVAFGQATAPAPLESPPMTLAPTGDMLAGLFATQPANPQRNYAPLRFDEDWRWLKGGSKDPDLFDPIKYVPLGPGGDLSASFGGSARLRYEWKLNPGFGATSPTSPTKDDDYLLERAYLHADLRYLTHARVFVEGVFSYIDGYRRNPPPTPFPSDDADLHQAFVDLSPLNYKKDGFGATLRIGRQELLLDKQKLVGPLDWANVRRSWDGVAGLFQVEDYKATVFWVRPVQVNAKWFDTTDEETNFAGVHIAHPLFNKDHNYSVYSYYLNRSRDTRATFASGVTEFNPDLEAGNTDRVTVGGHVWGKLNPGWDYDLEGGVQVGRYGDNDILAGFASSELGYTFADVPTKPRLSAGYDYASGDNGRSDGKSNTFDQLFPTGHLYFGYIDLVGRQNIHAANVTVSSQPTPELRVWASWHTFCLASNQDALYNAGGQTVRFSNAGNAGSYIGNELDITATYQLGRHTTLLGGYGVFFPGDFIQNTGRSETVQMVYTSVEFKF